jgi:hypothetical protein
MTADLVVPTFTKKRLLLNSEFLICVVFHPEAKRNFLRFEGDGFEFRNSLLFCEKREAQPAMKNFKISPIMINAL